MACVSGEREFQSQIVATGKKLALVCHNVLWRSKALFDCCIYYSVVAMGGDGTVNKVADGLLTASQKLRDIDLKPGFTPTKARIPLGIIPIGQL